MPSGVTLPHFIRFETDCSGWHTTTIAIQPGQQSPDPLSGESPDPLTGLKGPTSKGRRRKLGTRGGKGKRSKGMRKGTGKGVEGKEGEREKAGKGRGRKGRVKCAPYQTSCRRL